MGNGGVWVGVGVQRAPLWNVGHLGEPSAAQHVGEPVTLIRTPLPTRHYRGPGPVDPPMVLDLQPKSATVTWNHPSRPNGIITHYNIYQNGGRLHRRGLYPFSQVPHRPHPACPEGVPAPRLYSDTPTSVLLSWDMPLRPNGELEGYVIERRASGAQQVSTVASVDADQPLRYLDSSAALSPWTSYEYRVLAGTLQGGYNSSSWQPVTTRPSRPAGLLPPQATALGPDSVQVTWSAPLMANGEIKRYEIRLPNPHISLANASVLNHTITGLVPYRNYSVTILACSGGGGYVGGCTESLPTPVTTLPTIPQDLGRLSIIAVSESYLAVSWQPPGRPNGPNVRYELLRQKTQQPLVSLPPEDLNLWYNIYAGAKLFHQDKGLSRFTTYQYKLLVHNDVGYASGEVATGRTLAGVPLSPSAISAQALNHTAIQVNWSAPSLQDLQGAVELYTLWINSSKLNQSVSFPPGVHFTVVENLQPSTQYWLTLQTFNGAYTVPSADIACMTADGEPEGVFPPEVLTLNSTAVRVLWAAPLLPNGAVTEYAVYLDGQRHTTGKNAPGSFELSGLLPFTVYDIQVEVCTVYACVKSNSTYITTVEDLPANMATPHTKVLSSRSVRLDWTSPGQPNGITMGYNVRRRALQLCEGARAGPAAGVDGRCAYLECPIEESVCGSLCYRPDRQDSYLPAHNASLEVCCGARLLPPLPDHQCCGEYYIPVPPGEVCCPDPGPGESRVSVGLGDTCCGGKPFFHAGGQICCGGALHDGFHTQCCGERLLDRDAVCCGDGDHGTAYPPGPGISPHLHGVMRLWETSHPAAPGTKRVLAASY
ncbi:hypothetical protein AAFF_G00396960 [Aldrovandia affinis]|uniref:Fibronectin type-III domain-containing protein n=1 Tax=Aldrovandia affinis TaxID=143900 RepID=A0AAD7SD86_9TELE|nr:hypothetical protein AAFF_G00396960 [Aldrovandia affinis]